MSMVKMAAALTAAVTLATGPLVAQERWSILVADSAARYQIPLCNLAQGGKVGDGQKQFRNGLEDKDPAKRKASLGLAQKTLSDAVTTGGQAGVSGAWYFLARTYLAQGDVKGADSAFTKAAVLAPDCNAVDIPQYRQGAWATLANYGLDLQRKGAMDSAMTYFRTANVIFTDLPHVMENMGVIFANSGFDDSAVVYFEKAAKVAEADTTLTENRNSATLNQAMVLQRLGRHAEAIAVLHKYLAWKPGDNDARKSLAQSFREAGMADSADALDQEMIAEFSRMNLDSLNSTDLMSVGVSMFNAGKYQESADVFAKLVARNAWSRDAVYNLANAYLALKNWDKLLETGKHLMEIESMNEDSYRLVGQAYRELKQQDNLLRTAEALVGLPVNIEITQFVMGRSSSRVLMVAIGRSPTDVQSKPIKPTPVSLAFEFLDDKGTVVGTSDAEIPALEPGKRHELRAEASGAGIVAWRYKRK